MSKPAANRRVIGLAVLASAVIMVVVAVLIGTGVISVPEQSRTLFVVALAATAVLDGLLGLYYLSTSTE